MNPDGTGVRELPQLGNAFDPVWSPQGSALAFVGSRGSATDVYASSGEAPVLCA